LDRASRDQRSRLQSSPLLGDRTLTAKLPASFARSSSIPRLTGLKRENAAMALFLLVLFSFLP
jgi:hypothetical protein